MTLRLAILILIANAHTSSASGKFFVDCDNGDDTLSGEAPDMAFLTVHRAQAATRATPQAPVTIEVSGVCELTSPLALTEIDSNKFWVAGPRGCLLSGGIRVPLSSKRSTLSPFDLSSLNFTTANIGELKGRGYAGGSGCILVDNYESAAAELFYRRADSIAGVADPDPDAATMRLARYPNRNLNPAPSIYDWTSITKVISQNAAGGGLITINVSSQKLAEWGKEIEAGGAAWAHGLWSWNWADSHRSVEKIFANSTISVHGDDYNHDTQLKAHDGSQGGNVYIYNLRCELDSPGEYHINPKTLELAFLPPRAALKSPTLSGSGGGGSYHISRLPSVIIASNVSNVTFSGFEIRHSRGGGVVIVNSTNVTLTQCTVADHGMMGVNVTNGSNCGIKNSDVYNCGDGGVILYGGDRLSLRPSHHFADNISAHANQRWLMNYAPNVILGGVGQSLTSSKIYDSPQIGLFMQGNDHQGRNNIFMRLGRQCSDCGAFYMGRDWTYRGNVLAGNTFLDIGETIWSSDHASVMTIYLDDQLSSVSIEENKFENCHMALQLGGGRANVFRFNTLNNSGGVYMDDRGGYGTRCCKQGTAPFMFLSRVPYKGRAYSKYIGLANILNDDPCLPKHNVLSDNVLCGGSKTIGPTSSQLEAWGSVGVNNTVRAVC